MNKILKEFNSVQFLLLLFMVFPILTYAVAPPNSFKDLIMIAVDLITAVLPVIVLLAFIYFLWGLLTYLKKEGDNKDDAKHMMVNGIIGFFVMASVWGFVGILSATLGTDAKKPDLGDANQYLTSEGVEDLLEEHQDELLEGFSSYQDNNTSGFANSDENGNEVIEQEEENSVPSWFSNLLPWNWFSN